MRDVVSRLLLVHGFTQTARSMEPLGRAVAAAIGEPHLEVVSLDAPGHGSESSNALDLVEGARDLGRRGGRGSWIGYSMGARFCLHLALERPDLVDHLVLISGTAGIDDERERATRRAADEALADDLGRIGVTAFVERWLAQPMFARLPDDPADRADRARNTAAGLASSLRLAGTGTQGPLWDRLTTLDVPVLVIAGELDDKFVALGARMAATLPRSAFEVITGAGHAVHLERPTDTAAAIAEWLRRQPPSASPVANSTP